MKNVARLVALTAILVIPSQPQMSPVFEVISIKPSEAGAREGSMHGMTGVGVSIPELCWTLSLIIGRPVLDRTSLTGFYDFKLEWTSDPRLTFPVEGFA